MDGEDELLAWLDRRLARPERPSPIGDDGAILDSGGPWAVTTDTQVAGTHFVAGLDPAVLARRLLAVNLSDLAAMGASPKHAFLVISAPEDFDHRRFFDAFLDACEPRGLRLEGGDLSRQNNLTLVLTLLGRPVGSEGAGATHRWLRRDGARPGHRLWVGGTLGESALGCELLRRGARPKPRDSQDGRRGMSWPESLDLSGKLLAPAERAVWRHLEPEAQLELGAWLATRTPEGAAMDVSDGLARDLHRLCRAGGVEAEVELDALPQSPDFESLCRALGLDAETPALFGGEDYVLLFTLPPGVEPPPELGARAIGRICEGAGEGVVLVRDGGRRPLPPGGWDHLLVEGRG